MGGQGGAAGASARREYERRRRKREAEIRSRHPRLGGLLVALRRAPATERSWLTGAVGEELVAAALDARCRDGVTVMHDRARPGRRANIDHIAIAPTGVWVIDTKHYQGKRVRVRRPLFGDARLIVDGRDRVKLVHGLAGQVDAVAAVAREVAPAVPVRGALCFVDADLPLFGVRSIGGHLVVGRRSLVKRLNADGPLTPTVVARLTEALEFAFPPTGGSTLARDAARLNPGAKNGPPSTIGP